MPLLLGDVVPAGLTMVFPVKAALTGLVLGGGLASLFSLLPLIRLRRVKPVVIFTGEPRAEGMDPLFLAAAVPAFALFTALVIWQLGELRTGVLFSAALWGFLLVIHLLSRLVLAALRRVDPRGPAARQAIRGLFRPGNRTAAILTGIAAALSLLFTLHLLERNLDGAFVKSFPPDSPNLYFIDIQASQTDAFAESFGAAATLYPVIRGRVVSVNGVPIDRKRQESRRGDNLARPMNLTYREHLLPDERIDRGGGLFSSGGGGAEVSVLDTVLEMAPMKLGDRLTFDIQGVPVTATISSIRTRDARSLKPFFYFVFRERTLAGAPRTFFSAMRAEASEVGALQTRAVTLFPNVSVIDVSGSIRRFAGFMEKLSVSIRFFTLLGLLAGLLILVSSVVATRRARVREAVYYKILGAGTRFVLLVFTLENLLAGLCGVLIASAVAQTVTALLCRFYFAIPWNPYVIPSLWSALLAAGLVVAVGAIATLPILREKPAEFLRRA